MKVPVHVMFPDAGEPFPAWCHVVETEYGLVLEVGDSSRGSWSARVLVEARDGRWLALAVASLSGAKDSPGSFPGSNADVSEGVLEPGSLGYGPVSSGTEEDAVFPPKAVSGGKPPPSSLLDATRRSDTKSAKKSL